LKFSRRVTTDEAPSSSKVVLTIYLVKSFEYRTMKTMVLKDIDLDMTASQLKELIDSNIQSQAAFLPYRNATLDTLRIMTKAHGAKPNNIYFINEEHQPFQMDKTLRELGVEHETEISHYNAASFAAFKANPQMKW